MESGPAAGGVTAGGGPIAGRRPVRSRHEPIALELAIIVLPSTFFYLTLVGQPLLFSLSSPADFFSPPNLLGIMGAIYLGLTWYGGIVLLNRGRDGLRAVHPLLPLVGATGVLWAAASWVMPRINPALVDDDASGLPLLFMMGGVFATPSALVGIHLLVEWLLARRRPA